MLIVGNRYSRTGQVFQRRRGDGGVRTVSAERLEETRSREPGFLRRLAWRSTPRQPTDWPALISALAAEHDLAVFCDNSAFDSSAPQELWEVLLSEPNRLVFTERVNAELLPWLRAHPNHPIVAAIRNNHPGISERLEPKPGQPGRRSFDYYMTLLSIRRKGIEVAQHVFRRQHGREPNAEEERHLADQVQQRLGQRGRLIATKKPGNLTDEALVYLAVEHAITTGKQTLVLTRDADVEEQFFKLLWMINTHYRGMLLADRYIKLFGSYRTYPFPDSVLRSPDGPFEPHNALIIERDPDLVDVLPSQFHFVGISCINAGVYTSQLSFGAETEMARLLRIKDETGGLNTNLLGERNMHASIHPINTGRGYDCAAVVHDRRKPVGNDGALIAKLDVAQALTPCEQIAHQIPVKAPRLWTPPARRRASP
jgi:hypothetical protein